MKGMVEFKLKKTLKADNFSIPYDPQLLNQNDRNLDSIIKKDLRFNLIFKTIIYPVIFSRNYLFVDGFIKRETGKLMRKFLRENTVFFDMGCGDMGLSRYLPKDYMYNAMDVSLSLFHLRKIGNRRKRVNVALASATDIPLDSNTINLAVCTEVLEHIADIDKALLEIYRILKPGGIFIISIPNNYCYKYQKKGPHSDHVNNWTFVEFKEFLVKKNFKYLDGYMKGFWIPLTFLPGRASYQLPLSTKKEFYNTNFFFVFKKSKDAYSAEL